MSYVLGNIPFFDCYARREYTKNLEEHRGEFIKGYAHAIRCVRGHSLMFQVNFEDPFGGAAFLLPLEALCWKPCPKPDAMTYVQPWDVFSSDFGVVELDFCKRGAVSILPDKVPAQYHFTIDFIGSDLAEHFEQHKSLHVCFLESGLIGAFPNNRVLWDDAAFWQTTNERPDFKSLAGEYRAEGNQHLFRVTA